MKKILLTDMIMIALMAALLGIVSQIIIPIGAVPISMAPVMVYIIGAVLGSRNGSICFLVYLLLGMIGIPVFSMGRSGLAALLGPTGGYIVGYLFIILLVGYVFEHYPRRNYLHISAMAFGMLLCYTCGSIWYSLIGAISLKDAIKYTVLPFIFPDAVKIIIAELLIIPIRRALIASGRNI